MFCSAGEPTLRLSAIPRAPSRPVTVRHDFELFFYSFLLLVFMRREATLPIYRASPSRQGKHARARDSYRIATLHMPCPYFALTCSIPPVASCCTGGAPSTLQPPPPFTTLPSLMSDNPCRTICQLSAKQWRHNPLANQASTHTHTHTHRHTPAPFILSHPFPRFLTTQTQTEGDAPAPPQNTVALLNFLSTPTPTHSPHLSVLIALLIFRIYTDTHEGPRQRKKKEKKRHTTAE